MNKFVHAKKDSYIKRSTNFMNLIDHIFLSIVQKPVFNKFDDVYREINELKINFDGTKFTCQ